MKAKCLEVQAVGEKKVRNSNIEVLRILLMVLIVMLHFCKHGAIGESANGICNLFYYIVLALGTCAVNCFVIISGYFGIKFTAHKFLKMWVQLFAWNALIILARGGTELLRLTPSAILQMLMPFSQNVWWFATNYLILMLLAPFLNKLESTLSAKQLNSLLVILLACFTITPMISESPVLDTYGYDIVIFSLCYLIGRCLRRKNEFFFEMRLIAPIVCVIGVLIMFAVPYFVHNTRVLWYNSPIVMITAIMIFIAFSNLKMGEIGLVNRIAQSTFAVYLISDHPVVRNWLYSFLPIKNNINNVIVIPYVLLFTLVVFVTCIIAEKVRVLCFSRLEDKILKNGINKLHLDVFERILSSDN